MEKTAPNVAAVSTDASANALASTGSSTGNPTDAMNSTKNALEREQFSMYRVRNDTGMHVTYLPTHSGQRSDVDDNTEVALRLFDATNHSTKYNRSGSHHHERSRSRFGGMTSALHPSNSKSITVIARSVVLNKAKLINTIYLRSESFVKVDTFGTTVHGLRSLKDDLIKTSKRTVRI